MNRENPLTPKRKLNHQHMYFQRYHSSMHAATRLAVQFYFCQQCQVVSLASTVRRSLRIHLSSNVP